MEIAGLLGPDAFATVIAIDLRLSLDAFSIKDVCMVTCEELAQRSGNFGV